MSSFWYDEDGKVVYRTLNFLGYVGYRVGTDGSVWSRISRGRRTSTPLTNTWRMMKLKRRDYPSVGLVKEGKQTQYPVHHLVLLAFVGPRPADMEACHFPDRNKNNCCVENLRWDTRINNNRDKHFHGTSPQGERNPNAILTDDIVRKVHSHFWNSSRSVTLTAREFGLKDCLVSSILHGRSWKHLKLSPLLNRGHLTGEVWREAHEKSTRRGEQCSQAKLSLRQVRRIRLLLRQGKLTHKKLAVMFHVSSATISSIAAGRNWSGCK